jgi:AcrR family transcriptional regulator
MVGKQMKTTFFKLKPSKQDRIIAAALREFSIKGYERATLDRIIADAEISKGGLYEYIDSKEDLFIFLMEYSYKALYSHILASVEPERGPELPGDLLERIRFVATVAVDFYVLHPEMIAFITGSAGTADRRLLAIANKVLDKHFDNLFSTSDFSVLRFVPAELLKLLKWLLVKTRTDFLENLQTLNRPELCRQAYLQEWDFFLEALKKGIYIPGFVPENEK